jgi:hypothetical protein
MADLLEQRAERLGITFHRNKTLDAFLHAADESGPLRDLLFAITRPAPDETKKKLRELVAEKKAIEAAASLEPVTLPKGMVQYRREHWGGHDDLN